MNASNSPNGKIFSGLLVVMGIILLGMCVWMNGSVYAAAMRIDGSIRWTQIIS
jgi:hypothetical protein